MMWGKRWYYFYLKYLKDYGIHPVDVFTTLLLKIARQIMERWENYSQIL